VPVDDEGLHLTEIETEALALRLVAGHVPYLVADECVAWDDVPELDQKAWAAVADAIVVLGRALEYRSIEFDRLHGVDSTEILRRTS